MPGNPLAPGAARRFIRAALADWAEPGPRGPAQLQDCGEEFVHEAGILVNELVTNAVVHAGTSVDLLCRLESGDATEPAALVIEVSDHHPARALRGAPRSVRDDELLAYEHGRGLHVVAALAECWGITYRPGLKTVWARLTVNGEPPEQGADHHDETRRPGETLHRAARATDAHAPAPHRTPRRHDRDWVNRGALSFLAEASDLLAGQFDEDLVATLAAQLLVPRLADWCAIWLDDAAGGPLAAPRLARVWHAREAAVEPLRAAVEKEPPRLSAAARGGPVPMPWPSVAELGPDGAALAYRLVTGGREVGVLLLGQAGPARIPDEITGLIEDFLRRVALAIGAARQYTRQATISRVLQRGLLPSRVAVIPGIDSAFIYQPSDEALAGGDFYDVFPGAEGRWCFALGDVQGSGPEAAVVTGLARPWLRLLAREGHAVHEVLHRLNQLLVDDATEAAEAAVCLAPAPPRAGPPGPHDPLEGPQARFLSLLYGELVPDADGGPVRCTLASAGHPLPLLLRPDGSVRAAAAPQILLGVIEGARYESESLSLDPGDTLLCVTDGVTERRSGGRMFDDADGLATVLAGCAGLTAAEVAERIKEAVYAFGDTPPADDLALLVLRAG
ncbi:SpoIIE family protein phosphatase [Streptomyces sp. ASQP_92]|uniref:SpoIIE family protein phosphatase n=1 Tax=Streptomyces sp. ASQP_92 TaxID=2979116 RepID=UPI0021BE2033|nr:SpoIIE family protein phosphatase [Streptomyces sp. ASQP_92]MCT9087731.1 SpoIIE family protein phosphatase [Streptomyces sp. ASQP_92]